MGVRAWIAVGLFVAWSVVLSFLVWNAALSHAAGREKDLMSKQLDQVLDGVADSNKRAEKLQKTLDRLPKSEGKVREIVRDNPSGCVLPPAVVDGLREAIRSANAARALPSDS